MKKKNTLTDTICRYCENAAQLLDDTQMLCAKKGVVSAEHHCRSFRYDPLKRVPGKIPTVAMPDMDDLTEPLP